MKSWDFSEFALNLVSDPLLMLVNGRITFANAKFCELTNVQPNYESMEGEYPSDFAFLPVEQRQLFKDTLTKSMETQESILDVRFFLISSFAKNKSLVISANFCPYDSERCCVIFSRLNKDERERLKYLELFDRYCGVRGGIVEYDGETDDCKQLFLTGKSEITYKGNDPNRNYVNVWWSESEWSHLIDTVAFKKHIHIAREASVAQYECLVFPNGVKNNILLTINYAGNNPTTGNPLFVNTSDDLTHLRDIEEELKRKEEVLNKISDEIGVFRGFVNLTPLQLLLIRLINDDTDVHVDLVNSALQQRSENKNFIVLNKTFSKMSCWKGWEDVWLPQLKTCMESGQHVTFEVPSLIDKTLLLVIVKHISDRRFLVIAQDISKRKKFQDELEETVKARTAQLEQALQVKTRFLAIMSHEIRTPLSGVMGMLSLLSDTNLSPQSREMVKTAHICGEQLMTVINDILDLSKMEENKVDLERLPFSLRNAIEDSLEIISFHSEKKQIELIADIDPDLQVMVIGDAIRLRQILINLLSNAVKFSERGDVTMIASSRDLLDGRCEVTLTVEDEGIGIDPVSQQKLFQPFSQADTSVTRRYGGSGLGLSISKRIAELMGGSLTFVSEVNKGSKFTANIIIQKGSEEEELTLRSKLHSQYDQVIFIDPNVKTLKSLVSQLHRLKNAELCCFQSIEDLEEKKAAGKFVQVKNAIAFIEQSNYLRREDELSSGAIFGTLFITGNAHPSKQQPFAFLKKPIRSRTLLQILSDDFAEGAPKAPPSPLPIENLPSLAYPPPTSPFWTHQQNVTTDRNKFEGRASLRRSNIDSFLKILVAEDNLINQRLIQQLLVKSPYDISDIILVENGLQALEYAKSSRFDIILMDLMMPEMDGIEATLRIRSEVESEHQPYIIALTASAFEEDRVKCLQSGMQAVVTKPINKQILNQTIELAFDFLRSRDGERF